MVISSSLSLIHPLVSIPLTVTQLQFVSKHKSVRVVVTVVVVVDFVAAVVPAVVVEAERVLKGFSSIYLMM